MSWRSRTIRNGPFGLELQVIGAFYDRKTKWQQSYDRHQETLEKLQDNKDKSLSENQAMYKAENKRIIESGIQLLQ